MASRSGWNLWVWLGWNLWVWLVGVVVRRYIDFLILPTPLVSAIFCSSISCSLIFIFLIFLLLFKYLYNRHAYKNVFI